MSPQDVDHFLNWLENIEYGIDLLSQDSEATRREMVAAGRRLARMEEGDRSDEIALTGMCHTPWFTSLPQTRFKVK